MLTPTFLMWIFYPVFPALIRYLIAVKSSSFDAADSHFMMYSSHLLSTEDVLTSPCQTLWGHLWGLCVKPRQLATDRVSIYQLAHLSPSHAFAYVTMRRFSEMLALQMVRWTLAGAMTIFLLSGTLLAFRWRIGSKEASRGTRSKRKGTSRGKKVLASAFLMSTFLLLSVFIPFVAALRTGKLLDCQLEKLPRSEVYTIVNPFGYLYQVQNTRPSVFEFFSFSRLRSNLFETVDLPATAPAGIHDRLCLQLRLSLVNCATGGVLCIFYSPLFLLCYSLICFWKRFFGPNNDSKGLFQSCFLVHRIQQLVSAVATAKISKRGERKLGNINEKCKKKVLRTAKEQISREGLFSPPKYVFNERGDGQSHPRHIIQRVISDHDSDVIRKKGRNSVSDSELDFSTLANTLGMKESKNTNHGCGGKETERTTGKDIQFKKSKPKIKDASTSVERWGEPRNKLKNYPEIPYWSEELQLERDNVNGRHKPDNIKDIFSVLEIQALQEAMERLKKKGCIKEKKNLLENKGLRSTERSKGDDGPEHRKRTGVENDKHLLQTKGISKFKNTQKAAKYQNKGTYVCFDSNISLDDY